MGFLSPRLRMLSTIFSNFLRSRQRGLRIRMRSSGMNMTSFFMALICGLEFPPNLRPLGKGEKVAEVVKPIAVEASAIRFGEAEFSGGDIDGWQ